MSASRTTLLIGLTGSYCAGKNAAAAALSARGFQVLDVDTLGHRALEDARDQLVQRFGPGALDADGHVNRRYLGQMAYGAPQVLQELEEIVHPRALELTNQWIQERQGERLVINAALLHRMAVMDSCDFVIMVKAPVLTRIRRARRRDKLTIRRVIARFWAQRGFEAQYFRKGADIYTVENRGTIEDLARKIDAILARVGMDR